jgi:hypothetical protein
LKDAPTKACVGIGAVVALYAIYSFSNPGGDGYLFGTVCALVAGLAGYTVAAKVIEAKKE